MSSTVRLDPDRVMASVRRQSVSEVGETWLKVERYAREGEPGQRLQAQDLLARLAAFCAVRAAKDPIWKLLLPSAPSAGEGSDHGLLRFWGYSVGHRGQLLSLRRDILDHVFRSTRLPPVYHPAYLQRWGEAESATRLLFMAVTLCAFIADKRRDERFAVSVQEWRSDLEHLRATYHQDRFDFTWPAPR